MRQCTVINSLGSLKPLQKMPRSGRVGIRNISDYSPFGVLLKERTVENDFYRRAFNGMETDDEVKGDGNSVNFKYRMHDPRVGRFFATDPLKDSYSELSTYQFASNSPIFMLELEGLEGKIAVTTKWYTNKGIEKSKTQYYTVDGLKADLIKICWKPFGNPKGPVIEIDYFGRTEDGTRSGNSLNNINPDAKPTVAELNAFFARDPNNSYNVKKVEKARAAVERAEAEFDNSVSGWIYNNVLADGAMEGGDDGANTGNNAAGEQAPWPVKVIAGLNPLVSIPNAVSVLTTETDIYGVEASTKTDKVLAVLGIVGGLGGFSKIAAAANASDKVVKVAKTADKVNTVVQGANDAGALDGIK